MTTCPTCGRMPSERVALASEVCSGMFSRSVMSCPDPIHDLADRVVELREALRKTMTRIASMPDRGSWLDAKELGEIATDIRKALEVNP